MTDDEAGSYNFIISRISSNFANRKLSPVCEEKTGGAIASARFGQEFLILTSADGRRVKMRSFTVSVLSQGGKRTNETTEGKLFIISGMIFWQKASSSCFRFSKASVGEWSDLSMTSFFVFMREMRRSYAEYISETSYFASE